jgi:hypothetical protein
MYQVPPPDNLPMSSFSFARLSVQERALLLKLTQNPRCAFRHALDLELWDARDEVPLGKRQNTSQTENARVGEEWVPIAEALLYGIVWM